MCTKRVVHELDLNGHDGDYTINGASKARSSKFVDSFVLFLDGATTIDSPKVYSVDKLPVNPNHVNYNDLQR